MDRTYWFVRSVGICHGPWSARRDSDSVLFTIFRLPTNTLSLSSPDAQAADGDRLEAVVKATPDNSESTFRADIITLKRGCLKPSGQNHTLGTTKRKCARHLNRKYVLASCIVYLNLGGPHSLILLGPGVAVWPRPSAAGRRYISTHGGPP